ncbi:MAG: DNA-directed RNA polymerase subunit alpha C-terminal domain-containing protein [Clostridia bacterium]
MIKNYNTEELAYPENLYVAIFGRLIEMPADAEETLAVVLMELTEREQEVLDRRYVENLSLVETGKLYEITRERIRQVEAKALRKLRWTNRANKLLKGLTVYAKENFEQKIKFLEEQLEKETIYNEHLTLQLKNRENMLKDFINIESSEKKLSKPTSTPVEKLNFSVRTYNLLVRSGIYTIQDIRDTGLDGLEKVRNMGGKSLEEIRVKLLDDYGITLQNNNKILSDINVYKYKQAKWHVSKQLNEVTCCNCCRSMPYNADTNGEYPKFCMWCGSNNTIEEEEV